MAWFLEMVRGQTVAGSVLILAGVIALGLALGSIRIRGLGLGIAGVLFAGLAFGHFGAGHVIHEHVLEFMREFGLILFVYTIGVQVGPGFIASLRRAGLPLNLMAAAIGILGTLTALGVHYFAGVRLEAAVGLLSGGTTNTPSLAAAQQALRDVSTVAATAATQPADADLLKYPGLGYAIAYPFGVIGIILAMVLLRRIFRINLAQEEAALKHSLHTPAPHLERLNLEVTNPNLAGLALKDIPLLDRTGVVISRIYQDGELAVPQPETRVKLGDILLAVGPKDELDRLRVVVGRESTLDLRTLPTSITTKRIIVTRKSVLGRTIDELDFVRRLGVRITRVSRAEIEMSPTAEFALQYGDTVLAVGEPQAIDKAARELGDSLKALNHPQLIPVFVGIALGVILGSCPILIPGIPAPVKLGLAGGPLLVAILLSRIGRIGRLVWYMPISANFMLREVGITLFLACVGLKAGDRFIATLVHGHGLWWLAMGALITLLPLLIVGLFARLVMKTNYLMLCGLLSGSMTDPPALAFANHVTGSEAPGIAYATVYPLTMVMRVLSAQLIILLLWR